MGGRRPAELSRGPGHAPPPPPHPPGKEPSPSCFPGLFPLDVVIINHIFHSRAQSRPPPPGVRAGQRKEDQASQDELGTRWAMTLILAAPKDVVSSRHRWFPPHACAQQNHTPHKQRRKNGQVASLHNTQLLWVPDSTDSEVAQKGGVTCSESHSI